MTAVYKITAHVRYTYLLCWHEQSDTLQCDYYLLYCEWKTICIEQATKLEHSKQHWHEYKANTRPKVYVCLEVTPCHEASTLWHFKGLQCVCLSSPAVQEDVNCWDCLPLKTKTCTTACPTKQCHIPGTSIFSQYQCLCCVFTCAALIISLHHNQRVQHLGVRGTKVQLNESRQFSGEGENPQWK
jgi:hypothetical protein